MGIFSGLIKAAVKTAVVLPISFAADFVTMGGELVDKRSSFTEEAFKGIGKSIKEMNED